MKYIIYNKEKAIIIDEDKTHILIQFENGTKICTKKNLHEIIETKQGELF